MARVPLQLTSLPGGNVDGAGAAGLVLLTASDATNDHVVNAPEPGLIVGIYQITTAANNTSVQHLPNRYGRPSAEAAGPTTNGTPNIGRMHFYYFPTLEGYRNAAGALAFNVSVSAHRVFAIKGGGG